MHTHLATRVLITLGLALAAAGVAHAGGIADQFTRLYEGFDRRGRALLIEVTAVDPAAPAIEGKVLRAWSREGNSDQTGAESQRFQLLGGPDTSDASEWVMHSHYWNDMPAYGLGPGHQVLLVPSNWGDGTFELVAATEANLARVALIADADFPTSYQTGRSVEQLEADLADFDLYEAAYAGLVQRGALRHEAVLAAAPELERYTDLLEHHLAQLPAHDHGAFYVALAATIPATGYTNHGWRFDQHVAERGYDAVTADVLLAVAAAVERRDGHDSALLDRHVAPVVAWLQTAPDQAPRMAPFMLAWIRTRSSMRCEDPDIATYLGLLKGPARQHFVTQATALVSTSNCAMGQTDTYLAGILTGD